MSLAVGQQAPAFEAKIETGATVRLSDYLGKKVILYFYPKDATPGCTAQACNLRDNYEQLLKAGVHLALSARTATPLKALAHAAEGQLTQPADLFQCGVRQLGIQQQDNG